MRPVLLLRCILTWCTVKSASVIHHSMCEPAWWSEMAALGLLQPLVTGDSGGLRVRATGYIPAHTHTRIHNIAGSLRSAGKGQAFCLQRLLDISLWVFVPRLFVCSVYRQPLWTGQILQWTCNTGSFYTTCVRPECCTFIPLCSSVQMWRGRGGGLCCSAFRQATEVVTDWKPCQCKRVSWLSGALMLLYYSTPQVCLVEYKQEKGICNGNRAV